MGIGDSKLHATLDVATYDELRNFRAYIGLGEAGTKEAHNILIFEQVSKHLQATAVKE